MNSAQVEAFERYEHRNYMQMIEAHEQREAREEAALEDATAYLLESYLRDPATPSDNFRTYTAEQQLGEALCSDEETDWAALLDLTRRAALGHNVQADARELLRKLAAAFVSANRDSYIRD